MGAHTDLIPTEGPEKPWQPKNWGPQHRMAVRLQVMGFKNKEIAQSLSLTESRVSIILNDPRAVAEREDAMDDIASNMLDLNKKLKVHAVEALEEVVDEMRHSKDERIRQRASFGILDRAGYTPVQKHQKVEPEVPADVADRMLTAMEEMKNTAVEADYEIIESDGEEEEAA